MIAVISEHIGLLISRGIPWIGASTYLLHGNRFGRRSSVVAPSACSVAWTWQ